MATPQPVPELIVAHTASRFSGRTCPATMSAYGGNDMPAAAPATTTPMARNITECAPAMTPIPTAASSAAPPTATRGPHRVRTATTPMLAAR